MAHHTETVAQAPPVAWLGQAPGWAVPRTIVATSLADLTSLEVEAAHVNREWAGELDRVRREVGSARIVLDLTDPAATGLKRRARTAAVHADVILLPTIAALEHFRADHPELAGSTTLFRTPLDLETWAPETVLAETHAHSRELKRLRRLHRLAGPIVLYVGPYTEAGGLAATIDAVIDLHTRHPDLRLVAIPEGTIHGRYLDRCERKALGLGHHCVVEWTSTEEELPFWYALAAVVVAPDPEPADALRARRAAAAGRPFVGVDSTPAREAVVGATGTLVAAPANTASLVAAIERYLTDPALAAATGAAARARVEAELSHAVALRRLESLWTGRTPAANPTAT